MTVRVRTLIELAATLDTDETQHQFTRPNSALSQVIETFDVESSGEIELAASEADFALPLAKVVTGKVLYLETAGSVTVKLDGEGTGHTLGSAAVSSTAKLFLRSEFTSAPLLTNLSSSAVVTVSYFIAGEKT